MEEPGYGFDIHDDIDYPFYHGLSHGAKTDYKKELIDNFDEGHYTSELVYPLKFIENLAHKSAKTLRFFCVSEIYEPHLSYTFGSYWFDFLNELD